MQMKWMRDCLHWDWALRDRESNGQSHWHTQKFSLSLTRLMVLGKERLKCERVWMTERKRERNSSIYRRRSVQHVLAFSDLSIHGSTDKSNIFYFNLWTQFKIIIFFYYLLLIKFFSKKYLKIENCESATFALALF